MARSKGGKSDNCWKCGTRLDAPHNGVSPEPHGCGLSDCVRCPKCGSGICEYDPDAKAGQGSRADKAAKMKGMAKDAIKSKGASAGGSGGSGGSGGDPKNPKDYLPAVDLFPVDVLPQPLQRYVNETAQAFGCPVDYPAVSVLAHMGAAIGNTRVIAVKSTYRASGALYVGIVGEPGAVKTHPLIFVSAPVDRRQDSLIMDFRRAWAEYQEANQEAAEEVKEAKKEARKKKKEGAMTSEEAIATTLKLYDGPKKPILQRIVTSDSTVEALCELLADNPRGMLLKRDELIGWGRGMDMYRKGKGTDRQFYLSALSHAPYTLDRKSNKDKLPINIPRPFLCVLGCLTPDMLSEFSDEQGRDDGFVDRVMWTYPDIDRCVLWSEQTVSEQAVAAWESVLQKLWTLQLCCESGHYTPKAVELLPAAKRAWVEFYNAITMELAADDFPSYLVGPWKKLRDFGARLTLIIHEARYACGETRAEAMVDEASVWAAARLVDYFKTHVIRVHAMMGSKTQLPEADAALVEAVTKLVAASSGRWCGSAKGLRADITPHAGTAVELPRWPQSNEAMGHAIRRIAGHLHTTSAIKVTPPPPTDKARTIILTHQPPKPPKPPDGGATPSAPSASDDGGSGHPQDPTAQTAQEDIAGRAARAVDPSEDSKPPEAQEQRGEGVADSEGGLGGLGGSSHNPDDMEDVEDDAV